MPATNPLHLVYRRLYRSGLLGKLTNIGFNGTSDSTLTALLVPASVVLSIASGYTTWLGMCQYLHGAVALLVTIGVQVLLYSACWRIGNMIASRNPAASVLIIYVVTAAISGFFSYSNLVDSIYDQPARERRYRTVVESDGEDLLQQTMERAHKRHGEGQDGFRQDVLAWSSAVTELSSPPQAALRSKVNQAQGERDAIKRRLQTEIDFGSSGRQGRATRAGYGPKARRIAEELEEYEARTLIPLEAALTTAQNQRTDFEEAIEQIVQGTADDQIGPLQQAITSCHAVLTDIRTKDSPCAPGETLIADLRASWEASEAIAAAKRTCTLRGLAADDVSRRFRECLYELPGLSHDERVQAGERIDSQLDWVRPDSHFFTLSLGLLRHNDPLALSSLAIAISVDLLILLCGFLGARPQSYLAMSRPSDLDDNEEDAIATILQVHTQPVTSDPSEIGRLRLIIDKGRYDIDLAYEGFALFFYPEDLEEIGMSAAVGPLLARDLASEFLVEERVVVGLSIRLVFWIADIVRRHDLATDSERLLADSLGHTTNPDQPNLTQPWD